MGSPLDPLPEPDQFGLARGALEAFPCDARTAIIDSPAAARGYSGAAIFRVQLDGRTYCLRRWPQSGLPKARLQELHHFVRHLHDSGIDVVPMPVPCRRGTTLSTCRERLWQLEPWMPGVADFRDAPSEERMRDAMQLLARVHLAAEQYRPRTEGQAWFSRNPAGQSPAVAERSGVIADWTSDRISVTHRLLAREPHEELRRLMTALLDLYQARSRAVRSELHEMSELRFSLHPCLRDIWHDHVLFAGEQVTGLIDLAATRTENVAADLSRLLGSLLGDDDARWERALLAYQEVRTLTHAEHQLVGSLDRSSVLLSGMTWIDRRLTGCLRDEEIPHVLPRLESILNRLDRLRV